MLYGESFCLKKSTLMWVKILKSHHSIITNYHRSKTTNYYGSKTTNYYRSKTTNDYKGKTTIETATIEKITKA